MQNGVRASQLVFTMSNGTDQLADSTSIDQSLSITIDDGLAIEFKPQYDGRQRYRIASRDDGPGWWLIEEAWTGCTWRPVGREPVRDVSVWTGDPPE